jgi:hypothetical protein
MVKVAKPEISQWWREGLGRAETPASHPFSAHSVAERGHSSSSGDGLRITVSFRKNFIIKIYLNTCQNNGQQGARIEICENA